VDGWMGAFLRSIESLCFWLVWPAGRMASWAESRTVTVGMSFALAVGDVVAAEVCMIMF